MRSDAEPPEHGDWFESGCAIDVACSGEASAEQFQQRAELLLLRNRGLGPLAMTISLVRLGVKKSDHRHSRQLRAHRERPRGRRAADERDELAPSHSITSSVRAVRI
jgi:hypothetical protein